MFWDKFNEAPYSTSGSTGEVGETVEKVKKTACDDVSDPV